MKISPIAFLKFNNRFIQKQNNISNLKYKTLRHDTVSFGYLHEEVPQNIQVYRCIGKEEYLKLLQGESIWSSGYATSDPRGWSASGWNNGFTPSNSDSECYFITFKTGKLDISSRRDNEKDTRYGINDEYSLEDISNIRKGFNTHGELVWAENFEEAKARDIKHKKSEILRLIETAKNGYLNYDKEDVIDELISYSVEFPQITSLFEGSVDFSNGDNVNDFASIISSLNNEEDLPKFRKCMESYLHGVPAKKSVFSFLAWHGDKSDLDTYMRIADKNKFQPDKTYIDILINLSEEENFKNIISRFDTDRPEDLVLLSYFYESADRTGKYLKKVEKLLLKCDRLRRDLKFSKNEDDRDNLWHTIDTCMYYLIKYGNRDSLSVIEHYCKDDPKLIYKYYDAEYAKKKIEKRLNLQ